MKTWPDYVPTQYMVDPSKEYDTVGIHFAYTGSNHAVQKSEKDVTFIIDTDATTGTGDDETTTTAALVAAINEIVELFDE